MNALYALAILDALLAVCTVIAGKHNNKAEEALAWSTLLLMMATAALAFVVIA